ncbi:helix-turn-helix transcriptional regulator [Halopseudomonas pelagia]|uniref:AraC family transcriptional regulator n=1 Tax=Halopseudomonas pelagia TaxID=553151 RepID=A0AA91U405_9GAMM|nr:AraC family transcriptional regulator [Halopseudomonas pelagia]PCC99566.1 AraC family transcriptional regulator [Halopseudomonas pelagia]QFY56495.1 AraC family transcriptional regulator [Halopseudomonas pelagia]
MYSINYDEYDPAAAGEFLTESRLVDAGFDIHIQHAHWSNSGTAVIQAKESCLLRLVLPTPARRWSPFSDNKGRFPALNCDFQSLGQVLFLPRDTEFQFRHGVSEYKAMICLFDPSIMGPLAGIQWQWDDCLSDSMLNLENPFLHMSLQRLAQEVAAPGFASELHTECLLTSIALDLHRQFLSSQIGTESGKLSSQQLKTLRELVETVPEQSNSLKQLADVLDMPARRLSEQFKSTTGLTLRQYVAQARIRRAKSLLLDRSMLIKQISYHTGFLSPASFTAAFRKEVGMTPEAFRQVHQ